VKWVADGMTVFVAYSSFEHGNVRRYERAKVLVAAGDWARVEFEGGKTIWIMVDQLYSEEHVAADAAARLGAP
jgi:hypothetical protein